MESENNSLPISEEPVAPDEDLRDDQNHMISSPIEEGASDDGEQRETLAVSYSIGKSSKSLYFQFFTVVLINILYVISLSLFLSTTFVLFSNLLLFISFVMQSSLFGYVILFLTMTDGDSRDSRIIFGFLIFSSCFLFLLNGGEAVLLYVYYINQQDSVVQLNISAFQFNLLIFCFVPAIFSVMSMVTLVYVVVSVVRWRGHWREPWAQQQLIRVFGAQIGAIIQLVLGVTTRQSLIGIILTSVFLSSYCVSFLGFLTLLVNIVMTYGFHLVGLTGVFSCAGALLGHVLMVPLEYDFDTLRFLRWTLFFSIFSLIMNMLSIGLLALLVWGYIEISGAPYSKLPDLLLKFYLPYFLTVEGFFVVHAFISGVKYFILKRRLDGGLQLFASSSIAGNTNQHHNEEDSIQQQQQMPLEPSSLQPLSIETHPSDNDGSTVADDTPGSSK